MKLFSRKALVAGATAVAVAFAGTSVATAEPTNEPSASSDIFSMSSGAEDGESGSSSNGGDGELSSDPESIASWISVFTAIVGALAAAFSFATKYLGFKI